MLFSLTFVILILLLVACTFLVVHGGATALRLTGLDKQRASFQALSAVTGTGFTTREAELIMGDPARRRIVSFLMIFGNVVLATLIGLMLGVFTGVRDAESFVEQLGLPVYLVLLAAGIYVIYRLFMMRWLSQPLGDWLTRKLTERLKLAERPVHQVLTMAEGYGVAEIRIDEDSHCAGTSLGRSGLRQEGLLVLAIRRGADVLPNPTADAEIRSGDRLVCYGELERMHRFVRLEADERRELLQRHVEAPSTAGDVEKAADEARPAQEKQAEQEGAEKTDVARVEEDVEKEVARDRETAARPDTDPDAHDEEQG